MLSFLRRFASKAPPRPLRVRSRFRLRFRASAGSGLAAAVVFLVLYYATLALLPPAFAYPATGFPFPAWAHRLDLAQFFGTLLQPPVPTPQTWIVGGAVVLGLLAGGGMAYALLLAWAVQPSNARKGTGFGAMLFLGLGFALTLANGYHPAIMRNAVPDTGLFLMGWSLWATFHLLILCLIYGTVLGWLYGRAVPGTQSTR